MTLGLDIYVPEGATGDYNSNFIKKAECALKIFNETDKGY